MSMFRIAHVLLVTWVATIASADGAYFYNPISRNSQGGPIVEAKPAIPSQRAVIKFDGAEQTMLIESVLSGPQGSYAWVVPLPARPAFVRPVHPSYVARAFQQVKPSPQRLPDRNGLAAIVAAVLLGAGVATHGLRYRNTAAGSRILVWALECMIAFAIWHAIADASRSAETGDASVATAAEAVERAAARATVEDLGVIGSYSVMVVSGEEGASIREWLDKNGFLAGGAAAAAIDRYAKEGWCFLAAKIEKRGPNPAPPHPLKVVFPTSRCVYPMRLTGTQDGPLFLELLVIANRRAAIEGLAAWRCQNSPITVSMGDLAFDKLYKLEEWAPQSYAMAREGDVATYLRGELEPSQMRRDFEPEWTPFRAYEATVYEKGQAVQHAMTQAALAALLGSFALGLVGAAWPKGSVRTLLLGAPVVLVVAGVTARVWWGTIQTIETVPATAFGPRY